MSAARRAAVFSALSDELDTARFTSSAAAIDAYCSLSIACERAGISEASLAAAGVDEDAAIGAAARVLLRERAIRNAAGLVDDPSVERGLNATYGRVSTFANALEVARAAGFAAVEAPRAFLRAIATSENPADALAASSTRRTARKKGPLSTALAAAGWIDGRLRSEAAAADAVWSIIERAPDWTMRARLFCDSTERFNLPNGLVAVPVGSADRVTTCIIEFDDGAATPVNADDLGFALGAERALQLPCIFCNSSWRDAAAEWLASARRIEQTWPWPPAETPVRVKAGRMTFSASRLNAYAKCPRRWFFEYLCSAVEERMTIYAVYGKVYHAALESLHREVRRPAQWQPGEVLDRLLAALDAAFGRAHREFGSQLEYEVSRLRARSVADHYVRWLFEEAKDADLEIVEIEARQTATIGGHQFVGFIDRIDRAPHGGPVTIFDYKTGRIEDDPAEYLRQVRAGEEAQLALYYAMRRAAGDDVARVALVSIRDARDKTWVLALDITDDAGDAIVRRADREGVVRAACSPADVAWSLDVLTARCNALTFDGVAHFPAGPDPPCSYCAYERACRERPAERERIFAR